MKLNILKETERRIEVMIGGEGQSLLNLLQSSLIENPDVEMAGYSKPHPLMEFSNLFIVVKEGKDPQEILKKAAKNVKEKLNSFIKEFNDGFDSLIE